MPRAPWLNQNECHMNVACDENCEQVYGIVSGLLMFIEWASAQVPPTPLIGGGSAAPGR